MLRQQNPAFLAGFSIACPQGFSSVADTPYHTESPAEFWM